jgi:signal transduction histidine kinase
MHTYTPIRSVRSLLHIIAVPLMIIGVTVSLGILFHVRGEQVAEQQLRERLLSTVSIAALDIDPVLIERVRTPDDVHTQAFRALVSRLHTIRELSPHTRFVYIMRRTEDPMMLEFVADADALSTPEELDVNNNGWVEEDEEPGMTGDPYQIEDIPMLQGPAFEAPIVEPEITVDQWGQLLSAFAPLKDAKGNVIAVLGIDMMADEFFAVTQNTFSIVAVMLVSLVGMMLAIYILFVLRVRHMETLQELDIERTALLDLATHQLGMPLATFRWWLEILKERDNGRFCKRGDVCDQLQEGIDRMDMIIRGLQRAGTLKSRTFTDASDRSSIPVVIKSVIVDLQKSLNLRHQKLELSFPKNLPAVRLDADLTGGMLRELIENASFYSPHGCTITIAGRSVRGSVEIRVTDHGYGIPKQDLPSIFQQFKRGSNATKYKPAGNGLGLYIVHRIIERARGRIHIASELDKGTTVTVYLPAA